MGVRLCNRAWKKHYVAHILGEAPRYGLDREFETGRYQKTVKEHDGRGWFVYDLAPGVYEIAAYDYATRSVEKTFWQVTELEAWPLNPDLEASELIALVTGEEAVEEAAPKPVNDLVPM